MESFVERTVAQGLADLDRVEQSWLNLATSRSPEHVALALRWFGRHLNEYAWRIQVSMEVDALGAQLTGGPQVEQLSEVKSGTSPSWTGLDKSCPDLSKNHVHGGSQG
jgi:hypothetical protein